MPTDRKYKKALSRTLKALRGTRTQKEVAEAADIPTSTWCKIEQGRQLPRDGTFVKIAEALGCSVAELEQLVSESTLEEIGQAQSDTLTGPMRYQFRPFGSGRRKSSDGLDLSGLPETAALKIQNTLGTIDSLRNHLDSLEHDVKNVARELLELTQSGSSS